LNTIIKPLESEYAKKNAAVVYSLLVNRLYFLRIQSSSLSFHSINATRASLCEILAIRVLDQIYHHHLLSPDEALLSLANALVRCFSPFQGAPPDIVPHKIALEQPMKGQTSALESWSSELLGAHDLLTVMRVSRNCLSCKTFYPYAPVFSLLLAFNQTNLVVRLPCGTARRWRYVVDQKDYLDKLTVQSQGIYTGQIVYAATSFVDILPDHYKRKEITLYNPREAPILDHYRLKVPRVRQALETT
jgi:hypothetical protein